MDRQLSSTSWCFRKVPLAIEDAVRLEKRQVPGLLSKCKFWITLCANYFYLLILQLSDKGLKNFTVQLELLHDSICPITQSSDPHKIIDTPFWDNRPYKILTSKTGNIMVHFLLNSISFPVFSKLESTISQPFLIQLIWNFDQVLS